MIHITPTLPLHISITRSITMQFSELPLRISTSPFVQNNPFISYLVAFYETSQLTDEAVGVYGNMVNVLRAKASDEVKALYDIVISAAKLAPATFGSAHNDGLDVQYVRQYHSVCKFFIGDGGDSRAWYFNAHLWNRNIGFTAHKSQCGIFYHPPFRTSAPFVKVMQLHAVTLASLFGLQKSVPNEYDPTTQTVQPTLADEPLQKRQKTRSTFKLKPGGVILFEGVKTIIAAWDHALHAIQGLENNSCDTGFSKCLYLHETHCVFQSLPIQQASTEDMQSHPRQVFTVDEEVLRSNYRILRTPSLANKLVTKEENVLQQLAGLFLMDIRNLINNETLLQDLYSTAKDVKNSKKKMNTKDFLQRVNTGMPSFAIPESGVAKRFEEEDYKSLVNLLNPNTTATAPVPASPTTTAQQTNVVMRDTGVQEQEQEQPTPQTPQDHPDN